MTFKQSFSISAFGSGGEKMTKFERISVNINGDVHEVTFNDRKILDATNIYQMEKELTSLASGENVNQLLLRLGDVEFLSSAALNAFILLNKRVMKAGGKLVISELRPEIHEVFLITGLTTFFTICEDHDAALAAF
ncbi:MAG: STAS domain-containing protein [Pirellulaceae bacterium]